MGEFNLLNTALSNPNLSKTMRNYLQSVRNKAVKNSQTKKLTNQEKERQRIANNETHFKRIQNYINREKMLYGLQEGNLITYNNEGTKKNGVVLLNYPSTTRRFRVRGALIRLNPNTNRPNTFVLKSKNMNHVTKRNKGGKRRQRSRRRN
jgi:hypothetical protein